MKDQTEKRILHEEFGVKEYWIVNYKTLEVFIYTLKDDRTYGLPVAKSLKEGIAPGLFPDLVVRVLPEDLEF